jgi:uncharacterized protein (TIGR02172 family)
MEIDLGKPIAYGRTAEMYAWQGGQVLKLFYDWFSLDDIQYEANIQRAVHASGLPVPAVGEILRVNERNGLVYERVDGISMLEVFYRKPWRSIPYGRKMGELHAAMHASSIGVKIPSQREKLTRRIRQSKVLPAARIAKLLAALDALPDGDRLCHGDFHPGNILVTGRGEVIIDWIDSSLGNPLADLARTTIIILGAAETSQVPNPLLKGFVRLLHAVYLNRYFKLRPGGEAEYRRWLPVIAAARLNEGIPEIEKWLLKQAGKVS